MDAILEHTHITLNGRGIKSDMAPKFDVAVVADVEIDPVFARRKASRWLGDQVADTIEGGPPKLIVGNRTIWRVPVLFSARRHNITRSTIGHIDVDALTGEVLADAALGNSLLNNAKALAAAAPRTTR